MAEVLLVQRGSTDPIEVALDVVFSSSDRFLALAGPAY